MLVRGEGHRLAARRVEARVVARMVVREQAPGVIAAAGERLRLWLVEQAFPLWAERGRAGGWFAEGLREDGVPVAGWSAAGQREMVAAFALAGRLGWDGPWERLVGETSDLLAGCGAADGAVGVSGLGLCADRALAGFGRWRMFGAAADMWEVLAGVRGLEAATCGALPGLWRGDGVARGGDLWHWARVAAALLG